MRHRTCFLFLAQIGILILTLSSLAVGQQLDEKLMPKPEAIRQAVAASQAANDGWAAIQRKDYEAARQAFLKATTLNPQNDFAWANLAWSYEKLGQLSEAESAYKSAMAANPRSPMAYNNLGQIYKRRGQTSEAIAMYHKQIEVAPRHSYAFWNLGLALASRGQWDEARQAAQVATEITPLEANRWFLLGKTQAKEGRIGEARHSFDRTLALPHQPMMENDVAYEMADAGFDLDKSWQLVSGALENTARPVCEPKGLSDGDECTAQLRQMAYMLDTAGWVFYRQGKLKEAEPYLRSAFVITPNAEGALHIVSLLAKSGRLDEATTAFAQARARPDFVRVDSRETLRDLVKAVGGDAELDARLERVPTPLSPLLVQAKAIVLVDGNGKVIDARPVEPAPPGLANVAASLTLPALSWAGHSLRSVRTVEFQRTGDQWSPSQSYAGETPPPPPCGSVPEPLIQLTQQSKPARSGGCPGA
jgi:tetratricopeptide (TPR) repeat protein